MAVVTDSDGQSGSKQVYLPTAGSYEDLSLPKDTIYDDIGIAGLAALGNDIYMLGSSIITDETTLWKYDVDKDTWTILGATGIYNSFYCQIVGHDGKLYVTAYEIDSTTGYPVGQLWQYIPETKE